MNATAVNGTAPAAPEPVNITMVTFNRIDFTTRSIESIRRTAGYPYHLTVVDNASDDGTPAHLRELADRGEVHTLILNAQNKGVAFAANQGWAAGGTAHYLKVDNDIVFTRPGWLAAMVAACDAVPDLGALAYNFETTSYPVERIAGIELRPKAGNVGGACIMIPGRVHERVGYWCEDYWPYGEEDSDLYVRLRMLGLRSFYMADEAVGLHLPEGRATPVLDRGRRTIFDEGDPAYRARKDRWRTGYAGRRGLRRINETLYATGLRPIRVEHGLPYRPGMLARLLVAVRYLRFGHWERPAF